MLAKEQSAQLMAQRMPLVHYPANASFDDWSTWTALKSREALKSPLQPGAFGELRGRHVFSYAGPCCYYHRKAFGDAVLYFAAGAEAGKSGSATPFDSGSLEDEPARLQPFRTNRTPESERWNFFEAHEVRPLDAFRGRFASWLEHSYDDPAKYVTTTKDRWTAGEPQRLDPPDLLEHNGSRGRDKYGEDCGDRRSWTWEVRVEGEMSLDDVAVLHVPYSALDKAKDLAERIRAKTGRLPEIRLLGKHVVADYDALYEASGGILREMIFGKAP